MLKFNILFVHRFYTQISDCFDITYIKYNYEGTQNETVAKTGEKESKNGSIFENCKTQR